MLTKTCWKCDTVVYAPKHSLDMGGYQIHYCEECYTRAFGTEERDESDASCLGLPDYANEEV